MANTRFQYTRLFEDENDYCLRNTFIVVRLDGRGFTRFCKAHSFLKPNDHRALSLMSKAALQVMKEFPEIFIAYGQSDEYSFAFRRDASIFKRRRSKILSTLTSLFSSSYVFYWHQFMGEDTLLQYPPQFDARIIIYPSLRNLADYFSWRQADCHINNLYNTAFWALVDKANFTEAKAESALSGTLSKDKQELLFSKFGMNYDAELPICKKGSAIFRFDRAQTVAFRNANSSCECTFSDLIEKPVLKGDALVFHCDIIKPELWTHFEAIDH